MATGDGLGGVAVLRKRARILVIDDQRDAFPIEPMKSRGFNIDYWPDVSVDDLARLEQGQYDVVILDIRGVGASVSFDEGFGILQRLKRVRPALTIIAFSGASFDIGESQFFDLADDVLQKPVDVFTCEERLDAVLRQSLNFAELWRALEALLEDAGVGSWRRGRLRKKLLRALEKGGPGDSVKERLQRLLPHGEHAQTAMNLVSLMLRVYEAGSS